MAYRMNVMHPIDVSSVDLCCLLSSNDLLSDSFHRILSSLFIATGISLFVLVCTNPMMVSLMFLCFSDVMFSLGCAVCVYT